MDADQKERFRWIEMYRKSGDAGLACRRCGFSRPTLRKWLRRYHEQGIDRLSSLSSRPKSSPNRKIDVQRRAGIYALRNEILELGLSRDEWLSRTIIQRTLNQLQVSPIKRPRRPRKAKRYNRPVPGECVQMDMMQIRRSLYQYTSVDDCIRFRDVAVNWRDGILTY
jgi:transposase